MIQRRNSIYIKYKEFNGQEILQIKQEIKDIREDKIQCCIKENHYKLNIRNLFDKKLFKLNRIKRILKKIRFKLYREETVPIK